MELWLWFGIAIWAILLLSGAPMYVAFLLGSIPIFLGYANWPGVATAQLAIAAVDSYTLVAIPLFILLGNLAAEGGAAAALFDLVRAVMGHFRAGMAMVAVVVCALFGTMCGSGLATAIAVGSIVAPEMAKSGYSRADIGAIVGASGGLGLLIPPSITAIVLAEICGLSVADLFAAGVIPGLIAMVFLCIACYIKLGKNEEIKIEPHRSWGERAKALARALPAILIPVILILVIYMGIATPTESAGVGCIVAALVGWLAYRKLSWQGIKRALISTTRTSAAIFCIIFGAVMMGRVLAYKGIPQAIAGFSETMGLTPVTFLLSFLLAFFILGMFFDAFALLYVALPPTLVTMYHFDLNIISMCVMFTLVVIVGQITPPVCITLYAASTGTGAKSTDTIRKIPPYLIALLSALLLTTFIPQLSAFLPGLLK